MPDKSNSQGTMDPMDLWKQWNQSASAMLSNVMGGNKTSSADPYGLYQAWLSGMEEAQEQLKAAASKMTNPEEFWKIWLATTTSSWRKAAASGADPLGLTSQWLDSMEDAGKKMFAGGNLPSDPFSFFKQWYDTTSETWSKVVGDIISTEEFSHTSSQYLDNYLGFIKTSRRVYEEYFKNLQLPTRSDITRVAGLIVALEDKVDQIDDAVGDFDARVNQLPTFEAFDGLHNRLDTLESKLTSLPAVVEQVNAFTGLSGRLDGIEHQLSTVGTALTKDDALASLERRLGAVESKLDRVLTALKSLHTQTEQAAKTPSPPRKGKKNTHPAPSNGTSSDAK